jgi:hypothetical protein
MTLLSFRPYNVCGPETCFLNYLLKITIDSIYSIQGKNYKNFSDNQFN